MTDNPIHKILHEDYGLIYGEHYTEAYVVGTKNGYRIIVHPILKINYLKFELEAQNENKGL